MNGQRKKGSVLLHAVILIAATLLAGPVLAAKSEITNIDQASALKGRVTPGDKPGYPVTISQPGSYLLKSNLFTPSDGAIEITSGDVTINLNGFMISGTLPPTGNGSGSGIYARDLPGVTVTNGVVRGMERKGIFLGPHSRITAVKAFENGTDGMFADEGSIISGNTAAHNGRIGIFALARGVLIIGNTAVENGDDGIRAGVHNTIKDNTSILNQGNGIHGAVDSTISGNTVGQNGEVGIIVTQGCLVIGNNVSGNVGVGLASLGFRTATGYKDNTFVDNNGDNDNPQINPSLGVVIEIGTNICGTNTTCP